MLALCFPAQQEPSNMSAATFDQLSAMAAPPPAFDFEHKYWIMIFTRNPQPDRSKCIGGSWSNAATWLVNPKSFGLMERGQTFIALDPESEKP
jgi:hypothetical protein